MKQNTVNMIKKQLTELNEQCQNLIDQTIQHDKETNPQRNLTYTDGLMDAYQTIQWNIQKMITNQND